MGRRHILTLELGVVGGSMVETLLVVDELVHCIPVMLPVFGIQFL